MKGYQTRRTCGIEHHAGPLQVEKPRDPVGEKGRDASGTVVSRAEFHVFVKIVPVVVGEGADIARCLAAHDIF